MKVKKGKKIAYMTSRGAGGLQAGQNDGAVALQAGQKNQPSQLPNQKQVHKQKMSLLNLWSQRKKQEVAIKVSRFDEENEESDS